MKDKLISSRRISVPYFFLIWLLFGYQYIFRTSLLKNELDNLFIILSALFLHVIKIEKF